MSKLQRDQIVACWDKEGEDPDRRYQARRLGYATYGVRWRYCVPAQQIWPWMEKLRARIVCYDKEEMDAEV